MIQITHSNILRFPSIVTQCYITSFANNLINTMR